MLNQVLMFAIFFISKIYVAYHAYQLYMQQKKFTRPR